MKNIIYIIVFCIISLIELYCDDNNYNDSILINNIINVISNDTLFINMFEIQDKNSISFYVNDTTGTTYLSTAEVKFLFPDSSDMFIYNKCKYLKKWYERCKITHDYIPYIYKDSLSKYELFFDYMDDDIVGAIVGEKNNYTGLKEIGYIFRINNKKEVIRYWGSKYTISK